MSSSHNTPEKRIIVTGAAGRLGRAVASKFHESGFTVVATDVLPATGAPYPFAQVDLRDHEAVLELLHGANVVVHLGNHPGIGATPPQVVFNENVAINENIFQGAAETTVDTIVFASTIQLIGSKPDLRTVSTPPDRPDFPLSNTTLAQPANVYALSKDISEHMLRYYAERCGLSVTALRLPLLHNTEAHFAIHLDRETPDDIYEGFTGLTYDDAARLFLAVVQAELTGFNVFIAAESHRHVGLNLDEVMQRFFPETSTGIVDLEPVTRATGWSPSPTVWPPVDHNEPHGGDSQ